jgi:hypothetical protein
MVEAMEYQREKSRIAKRKFALQIGWSAVTFYRGEPPNGKNLI